MGDILDEIFEDTAHVLDGISNGTSTRDFFGKNNTFFDDSCHHENLNQGGCKLILYQTLGFSSIRIWDLLILIPNLIFFVFLCVKFRRAQRKLRGSNSPMFAAFYLLIFASAFVSVARCFVSMSVSASTPAGDEADKLLWILLRFCLLATEMSVLVFGIASGHLDSRSSIRRVVFVATFVSLAFSTTQAVLEFQTPDPYFRIWVDRDTTYDLFGHGGMLFWLLSSFVFTCVYFSVLILPVIPIKTFLSLPQKKSFYYYVSFLFGLNLVQTIGSILFYLGKGFGLCIVNLTTYAYFVVFIPVVYYTFLRGFFKVAQPTLLFSYKAQVDDTDEFHHDMQGFEENPDQDTNPIVMNNSETTDVSNTNIQSNGI